MINYILGAICGGLLTIIIGYIGFTWWAIWVVTSDKPSVKRSSEKQEGEAQS